MKFVKIKLTLAVWQENFLEEMFLNAITGFFYVKHVEAILLKILHNFSYLLKTPFSFLATNIIVFVWSQNDGGTI